MQLTVVQKMSSQNPALSFQFHTQPQEIFIQPKGVNMLLVQNTIKIWPLKPKVSTMMSSQPYNVCTIHYTYYKHPKYLKIVCVVKTDLVYKECILK